MERGGIIRPQLPKNRKNGCPGTTRITSRTCRKTDADVKTCGDLYQIKLITRFYHPFFAKKYVFQPCRKDTTKLKCNDCPKKLEVAKILGKFPYSPTNCSISECTAAAKSKAKKVKSACNLILNKGLKKACKKAADVGLEAAIFACNQCKNP